jgi:hypothetical protein
MAAVFGTLLLRFADEPSALRAATVVLVLIKGLKTAIGSSVMAVGKAFDRVLARAQRASPPGNPNLVPVRDIPSRPDIAGQHPDEPGHARD